MEKLKAVHSLFVQQRKEWGEILTGFETKNKYAVLDPSGEQLFWAAEESTFLVRMFLKKFRPFRIHVLNPQGKLLLNFDSPFRFYFREISVLGQDGRMFGKIIREFSVFDRQFSVTDGLGNEIYRIHGPFFHPWTFKIMQNGMETGRISKKWSGLGKELFSDADNFNIEFPPEITLDKKCILLGALFLIDMLYFENNN